MKTPKRRVAVFGTEPVTGSIGGLGIRQLEVARELSRRFTVRLYTPFAVGPHRERFEIVELKYHKLDLLREAIAGADAVYASQPTEVFLKICLELGRPAAVDLLALLYFEELEQLPLEKMNAVDQAEYFTGRIRATGNQLALGDFFLCSNERERDYYLGILTQLGRLNPGDYRKDPMFTSVIGIAPFGIPRREPRRAANMFRGVTPGIGKNDFILMWGGSLWNWYDCMTPLRAMKRLLKKCPRAKLVFAGSMHPATKKPTRAYQEALRYVTRERLLGKNVFFHSKWVPYEEHEHYLTEADAGVATFNDHLENRFSFRIRMVDYMWGNLPVLTNPGNTLSDLVERERLGAVFPSGDDKALADSVAWMAAHPSEVKKMRGRIAEAKESFRWERVLRPLVAFCQKPKKRKPVFDGSLFELSFHELNRAAVQTALFIRSSPMEHAAEGVEALRRVAPGVLIDVAIQPGMDPAPLGAGLNFITLPPGGISPEMASAVKGDYDAVVCSFNSNDLLYYRNVAAFAKRIKARHHWAYTFNHRMADVKGLLEELP